MRTFDDVLEPGLDKMEFTGAFLDILEHVQHEWMLHAHNDEAGGGKQVPIGILVANGGPRIIEPHVEWFPWATPRNKVEGMLTFLSQVQKEWKIFAFVRPKDQRFYLQMCRYGQFASGCKVLDYFGEGEDAYFFYTRGP